MAGEKVEIEKALDSIKDSISRLNKRSEGDNSGGQDPISGGGFFPDLVDYDNIQFGYQKPKRRKH